MHLVSHTKLGPSPAWPAQSLNPEFPACSGRTIGWQVDQRAAPKGPGVPRWAVVEKCLLEGQLRTSCALTWAAGKVWVCVRRGMPAGQHVGTGRAAVKRLHVPGLDISLEFGFVSLASFWAGGPWSKAVGSGFDSPLGVGWARTPVCPELPSPVTLPAPVWLGLPLCCLDHGAGG